MCRGIGLMLAWLTLSAGCGPQAAPGLDSPLAADRIGAMQNEDPHADDRQYVRGLIEQLDSQDPVVRRMANLRLKEVTGESFGYRYDDRITRRREAIDRWLDWFHESAPHE